MLGHPDDSAIFLLTDTILLPLAILHAPLPSVRAQQKVIMPVHGTERHASQMQNPNVTSSQRCNKKPGQAMPHEPDVHNRELETGKAMIHRRFSSVVVLYLSAKIEIEHRS